MFPLHKMITTVLQSHSTDGAPSTGLAALRTQVSVVIVIQGRPSSNFSSLGIFASSDKALVPSCPLSSTGFVSMCYFLGFLHAWGHGH